MVALGLAGALAGIAANGARGRGARHVEARRRSRWRRISPRSPRASPPLRASTACRRLRERVRATQQALAHQRQRGRGLRRDPRRRALRRRLSDHAGDRAARMDGARADQGRRHAAAGRGRARVGQHDHRRVVRRRAFAYRHRRAGSRADDRGHRPRGQRRGPDRRRRRDARRPFDRHPRQERAERPLVRGRRACTATRRGSCLRRRRSPTASPRRNGRCELAEAMQAPAIVLSDQFMGQSRAIIDRPGRRRVRRAGARPPRRTRPTTSVTATPSPAFRRWRFRARRASCTRPTASSTRKPEFPAARRATIALQLDKRERKLHPARLRPLVGRYRGRRRRRGDHVRLVDRRGARSGRACARSRRQRAADRAAAARARAARTARRGARRRRRACSSSSRTTARNSSAICARCTTCPAARRATIAPVRCRCGRASSRRRSSQWAVAVTEAQRMNDLAAPRSADRAELQVELQADLVSRAAATTRS